MLHVTSGTMYVLHETTVCYSAMGLVDLVVFRFIIITDDEMQSLCIVAVCVVHGLLESSITRQFNVDVTLIPDCS